MTLLMRFILTEKKKKNKAMTIHHSKDFGFVSVKKYTGNPGKI